LPELQAVLNVGSSDAGADRKTHHCGQSRHHLSAHSIHKIISLNAKMVIFSRRCEARFAPFACLHLANAQSARKRYQEKFRMRLIAIFSAVAPSCGVTLGLNLRANRTGVKVNRSGMLHARKHD